MKLGAEPKKVAILGGLLLVASYLVYSNRTSSDAPAPPARRTPSPAAAPVSVPAPEPETRPASRPRSPHGATQEFRPSLKPRRPEDRPDPVSVDPTLRLDLLAKLQTVQVAAGMRSLFEFTAAPAPPPAKGPEPKIIPKVRFMGPLPPPPPPVVRKLPPPPINLKFYGYVSPSRPGVKRAFFLDGDNIFVASEGDLIKHRYKVVRIGVNSAVVEDIEHKNQQTLPLVPELGS